MKELTTRTNLDRNLMQAPFTASTKVAHNVERVIGKI